MNLIRLSQTLLGQVKAFLFHWLPFKSLPPNTQVWLQQSHPPIQLIFDEAHDAIALSDAQGIVLAANPAYCQLYGYSREEVIGQSFAIIFPEERRPSAIEQYKQVFTQQVEWPNNYESQVQRKDGTQRIVEARNGFLKQNGRPIAMLSIIRDLTERKQAEDALRAQFDLTTQLARTVSIQEVARVTIEHLVHILDAQIGNIHLYHAEDHTFESLYTNSSTAASQLAAWQRFPAQSAFPITDVLRHNRSLWFGSATEREAAYPSIASFSDAYPGASALLPLVVSNEVVGVVSLIFAQPRTFAPNEQELITSMVVQGAQAIERARLYEAEQQARLAAEEANETKVRFMAMISHELRTPLTSIKGFASTILAKDVTWSAEDQRDFVQIIEQEADVLQSMIEELLDLSHLSSRTFSVLPETWLLLQIVRAAQPQLQAMTKNHRSMTGMPSLKPSISSKGLRKALGWGWQSVKAFWRHMAVVSGLLTPTRRVQALLSQYP